MAELEADIVRARDELAPTVDLTEVVHTDTQVEVAAAVAGVVEHCPAIEQARGMLMLALGLNPDDAFDVLRAHTQHSTSTCTTSPNDRPPQSLRRPGPEAPERLVLEVLSNLTGTCHPPSKTD